MRSSASTRDSRSSGKRSSLSNHPKTDWKRAKAPAIQYVLAPRTCPRWVGGPFCPARYRTIPGNPFAQKRGTACHSAIALGVTIQESHVTPASQLCHGRDRSKSVGCWAHPPSKSMGRSLPQISVGTVHTPCVERSPHIRCRSEMITPEMQQVARVSRRRRKFFFRVHP